MEKQEKIDYVIRVFSFLMKRTVFPSFAFPGGGRAGKALAGCIESLESFFQGEPGEERMIDYCICQVYAISRFAQDYLQKWNATHSFGKKAMERFKQNSPGKRYYEDIWLKRHGLSRAGLSEQFRDRSSHPLQKFIFPEYEEKTKLRMLNSEVGFYICTISTLLWTPFSPVCRKCNHAEKCREIACRKYPELYRIRMEEYNRMKKG
jgi:hypothetical protein